MKKNLHSRLCMLLFEWIGGQPLSKEINDPVKLVLKYRQKNSTGGNGIII